MPHDKFQPKRTKGIFDVTAPVSVIIAAYNAAATIGRAIESAIGQKMVGEIIVVDDASTDATADVARATDIGDGRVRVLTQTRNAGPAAARNLALAHSTSPFIAILDADDFFLPGRFEPLLAAQDWDLIADNIAFVREEDVATFDPRSIATRPDLTISIDLESFVLGNVPRPGHARGEMGFAKPVIRRDVLTKMGIGYDESLRLGEDFALYASLLAGGARFQVSHRCGYVAVERQNSLSGHHAADDLRALLAVSRRLGSKSNLSVGEQNAFAQHQADIGHRLHHREILEIRRAHGRGRALIAAIGAPASFPALAKAVFRDKTARPVTTQSGGIRYLF